MFFHGPEVPAAASASASPAWNGGSDGLGIQPGKIKHVWLIILENKSYDASFTGLNNNTYLWKTLPAQGVLLKNYYGSTAYPNPGSANATDQYVPKHFPFPWFDSILQSGDCNDAHIANLLSTSNGLYHDLQSAATTPAFSWISPNNCSDAHDAVCHGNNLSGGWASPTTPNPPVNYTGGLYAADLFLEHVIPEIEASPAFKQGGLIDIT